eukprot:scaffold205779_cov24-Tisochrysis_lutea.AAC.2
MTAASVSSTASRWFFHTRLKRQAVTPRRHASTTSKRPSASNPDGNNWSQNEKAAVSFST